MVPTKAKWVVFFKDAGIPSRQALEYATIFSDNRIKLDMLDELSRDLLRDLGITAVGDVIAILRHGKQKLAEMKRSPSPEVIEKAIAGPSRARSTFPISRADKAKQLPTPETAEVNKVIANPSASIKITTSQKVSPAKNQTVSNNAKDVGRVKDSSTVTAALKRSPSKSVRLSLSQRFDGLAGDAKRQKLVTDQGISQMEPETIQTHEVESTSLPVATQSSKFSAQSKAKSKETIFTIQLPNMNPPLTTPVSARPVQKVTVVPAQGKALNRTQHSTSIFDRLDVPSSSSTAVSLIKKNETLGKKKTVFNRLGAEGEKALDTAQKVQVVTGIVRTNPSQLLENKHTSNSVFNRLGDR